jgi:hypothetical protein
MADPDGTPSLEGFIPVAETPKVETPPAPVVPETPIEPEGTPAIATPAEGQQVVTDKPITTELPAKTPDQLAQDRAYFQQEAQKAKEELKRIRDEFTQGTAQPTPPVVAAQQPQKVEDRFATMSQEQLEDWIQTHPVEAMMAAVEKAKQDIRSENVIQATKDSQELAFKLEQREANRFLNDFAQRNKITQDEFGLAKQYVDSIGIKGSPTAVAEMVTDRLIMNRLLTNTAAQVETVKADAAQKVKQQLLTVQPNAGTTPQSKPMTMDELVASKFKPSKEDSAMAGFFGHTN